MEVISFEAPTVFVPEPIHIHILQAVGDKQGCHISHVVQRLLPNSWREQCQVQHPCLTFQEVSRRGKIQCRNSAPAHFERASPSPESISNLIFFRELIHHGQAT